MTRQPSGYEKHKDKSKKPTGYSSLEGKLTLNKLELQVKILKITLYGANFTVTTDQISKGWSAL